MLVALPVLVVGSLWRERTKVPYQWWRLMHGTLAALVLMVGLAHISQVRHYLANPWKQGLWIVMAAAAILSVVYARLARPIMLQRHTYRVTGVNRVANRTWNVTVAPDDGAALRFRAGQFAFVTFADSPFGLEQHPYSIASSAHNCEQLEFTIRELGDFTSTVGNLEIGQRAFVDGPFGSLTAPEHDPSDVVLLAGGIGSFIPPSNGSANRVTSPPNSSIDIS